MVITIPKLFFNKDAVFPLISFSKQVLSGGGSGNLHLRKQLHCYAVTSVHRNRGSVSRLPPLTRQFTELPREETEAKNDAGLSEPVPTILGRSLEFYGHNFVQPPREAWVESLSQTKENNLGIIHLHPSIFAAPPRLEVIHNNIVWQKMYRKIDWRTAQTRAERPGGGKKPWPQKGLGRARHGSLRSPIFLKGGQAHGPRGPTTYFFMLPFYMRVKGLCTTLSVKLAQDDVKIVDSLDIPTDDPKFLKDLVAERNWGSTVLFVDDTDMMPKNISIATSGIREMNMMPVYGLNCYSMLKHETLVLTLSAVNRIEEKLLFHLHTNDPLAQSRKYKGSGSM